MAINIIKCGNGGYHQRGSTRHIDIKQANLRTVACYPAISTRKTLGDGLTQPVSGREIRGAIKRLFRRIGK